MSDREMVTAETDVSLIKRLRTVSSTEIMTMYELTREAAKRIAELEGSNQAYAELVQALRDRLDEARATTPPPEPRAAQLLIELLSLDDSISARLQQSHNWTDRDRTDHTVDLQDREALKGEARRLLSRPANETEGSRDV
jgi:hypothetical protein